MSEISNLIEIIADTSSTNEKIEKLRNFKTMDFAKVLYYAYSPKFVYGLKKVARVEPNEIEGTISLDDCVPEMTNLLDALHDREITGNAAKNKVNDFLSSLDYVDQDVVINIIKRDLRFNMNAKTINKAIDNLIELPPPYQRCSLMKNCNFSNFPEVYYSQVKADGMFLNLKIRWGDGKVSQALTRNGNEFPFSKFKNFPTFKNLNPGESIWLAGEIILKKDGKLLDRKTSNGLCNSIMKGDSFDFDAYEVVYYTWDAVPDEFFVNGGKYEVSYRDRLNFLKTIISSLGKTDMIEIIDTVEVKSMDEAMAHYKQVRSLGLEGTIIKNPDAFWKDGTSPDQIKMKAVINIDLRVTGLLPGNGKFAPTFGALMCESECGKLKVNVSGLNDEMRQHVFDNFDSTYKNRIVQLKANEVITNRDSDKVSLFLPQYDEWRFDKDTADTLERIIEISASAI